MVKKKRQFNKTLYSCFINMFILKGKKKTIKDIIDLSLINLTQLLNISVVRLFFRLYYILDYYIEIKQVKIKRRTYTVPFSITYDRRIYLIIKKIKNALNSDKRKTSFSDKLKFELNNILSFSRGSKSLKLIKNNRILMRNSRSNIHYRWK